MAAELQASFESWAATAEVSILKWANPTIQNPVTKGWPLTRLDHCLYVLLPYLLMVAYGLVRKATSAPKKEEAAAGKGKEKKSLGATLAAEPIKVVQIIYNLAQVILCAYMIGGTVLEFRKENYPFICVEFREERTGMAYYLWVFYLSKILDFMDTFFMIWRGNYHQLSFLHVYHHISIYLVYWVNARVAYDGDIYWTIIANGGVHLVMYFYYLLTTLHIKVSWKILVTLGQLIQFVTMMSQAIYILYGCKYSNPKYEFPRPVTWLYLLYILSLFCLFMEFFLRTYTKKPTGGDKKKK